MSERENQCEKEICTVHSHPHFTLIFAAPRIQLSNTFYDDLVKLCELEHYLEVSGVDG